MSARAPCAHSSAPRFLSCVRALGLVFAVLLEMMPASGVAQSRASEVPGYREAVDEALAEFDAKNFPEARRFFELAHELFPNARTLRGLAVVSFELRRYSQCLDFGQQALASTVKPLDAELRGELERLITRARELVAELTIKVDPPGARVAIDGAGAIPVPTESLVLDVGPHELEFEAAGHASQRRTWTVGGGEAEVWNIALRKETAFAAATTLPLESQPGRRSRKLRLWLGGASIGLGAAAFAAAGAFTAKRHNEGQQLRAVQPGHPSYEQHVQEWQSTRPAPYIFGALGSVALTGGALGLLLGTERKSFPVWASVLTGVAGLGLSSWGTAEVVRGSSCPASTGTQSLCSAGLEQRDRGALLLLAAAPLLGVPITQSVRRSGTASRAKKTVAVGARLGSPLRLVFLDARVTW